MKIIKQGRAGKRTFAKGQEWAGLGRAGQGRAGQERKNYVYINLGFYCQLTKILFVKIIKQGRAGKRTFAKGQEWAGLGRAGQGRAAVRMAH